MPLQDQIERLVTNGLGYDPVEPDRMPESIQDGEPDYSRCLKDSLYLSIHLGLMKGQKEHDVLKELGFNWWINYADDDRFGRTGHLVHALVDQQEVVRTSQAIDTFGNPIQGMHCLYVIGCQASDMTSGPVYDLLQRL